MFPKIAEDSIWFCSQNGETSFEDILMVSVFYGIGLSLFIVYAAEAALKMIGLGLRKYFLSGWNT